MRTDEGKLQDKIVNILEEKGYYVLKLIQTNKNGIPDLEVHRQDGRTFYIEVKKKGKNAEPLQKFRHKELSKFNIKTYVIDSLEQFKKVVL